MGWTRELRCNGAGQRDAPQDCAAKFSLSNHAIALEMRLTDIVAVVAIGVGATLLIDLWGLVLRRAFDIRSLNYCLLGRWILHIPAGQIAHRSISAAAEKAHECKVGWTAHYTIGVTFALLFVVVASGDWLARPTLLPALAFGVATVLVPFFTMQPAFGLGIASARAPNPAKARLKSLMTHTVFGVGLWLSALVVSVLSR